MAEVQKPTPAIRSQIIANPAMILEDEELMAALLTADGSKVEGRNVVDLRGKLVERLEGRLTKLETTNRTVIAAAYENLAGTNQVHRAVVALLEAGAFRGFLQTLHDDVTNMLSLDSVRIGLETNDATPGSPLGPKGEMKELMIALPKGGVEAYLSPGEDRPARRVTLRKTTPAAAEIYGHGQAWVQSEAVLTIDMGPNRNPALLALGAEDPNRFSPDQGTDLLAFFGSAFERMLRRWLA